MAPKKKKDPKLTRAGVTGYNKPKRTPNHPTKSHVVVAKVGTKTKLIRFGQQGVNPRRVNLQDRKPEERVLKRATLKISRKVRCQLLIGQIKLNGKLYIVLMCIY